MAKAKRVVLTIKPKEYLKQGLTHCGAYSVKAILEAFGKEDKKDPKDYHNSGFNKLLGTGLSTTYWPNVLRSYGLDAKSKSVKLFSDEKKLQVIKDLLSSNHPVMLSIANGYLKGGQYSKLKALYVQHWITLWGYDDKEQAFYVYDSCIDKKYYDKSLPIGNTKRTYEQILRDWRGAVLWTKISPLRFFWGQLGDYHYIQISN